jgi:hypothetical protein
MNFKAFLNNPSNFFLRITVKNEAIYVKKVMKNAIDEMYIFLRLMLKTEYNQNQSANK